MKKLSHVSIAMSHLHFRVHLKTSKIMHLKTRLGHSRVLIFSKITVKMGWVFYDTSIAT